MFTVSTPAESLGTPLAPASVNIAAGIASPLESRPTAPQIAELLRRVGLAFADLRHNGVFVCKENKGASTSRKAYKLGKKLEGKLHRALSDDRPYTKGLSYAVYSKADTARLMETGKLHIAFGTGACAEAIPQVGKSLVYALWEAGLDVKWDAEAGDEHVVVEYAA